MPKQRAVIGVVLVVVALAGLVWGVAHRLQASSAEPAKPEAPALAFAAYEVVKPQRLALDNSIEFSGSLVAPNTAIVRAKAAGTLLELTVAEGSRVKAGAALGRLDLADLNARLQERAAQAESSRAQMRQAERQHNNNLRLAEQQFISTSAVEASLAALETAKAQLQAAQAQVETIRIALKEAALVSPLTGVVAKRHALPGEKVSAEQTLLTILDLRQLELNGMVGAHEVGQLRIGMPVRVQIEGVDKALTGSLLRIAPSTEPGTRSIAVAVGLTNGDERLRAGQFGLGRVTLPASAPVLTLPLTALSSSSGQNHVWTLDGGKLIRRVVGTGRKDAARGLVEITEGLNPDAQVLARRFDNLREGAPARVLAPGELPAALPASAPPPAAPPASSASARAQAQAQHQPVA